MRIDLNKDGFNVHHRQNPGEINIHDRVTQAYKGELGESFRIKTKRRVDWVVSKSVGPQVLDVGCSQGIVPILLGKKGIKVTGVDIDQSAVNDANVDLAGEAKKVRDNVRFICDDFLKYKPDVKHFDTVIFSEFLEHLYSPIDFIKAAFNVTRVGGRLIITVPFGVNDYPDHRQNFYLLEMYEMVSQYYSIDSVDIMGKWIGFVGNRKVSNTKPEQPNYELLKEAEAAFYDIERGLVDRTYELTDTVEALQQENTKILNEDMKLRKNTAKTWEELKVLRKGNEAVLNSVSFRIGRALTSPLRMTRKLKGKK